MYNNNNLNLFDSIIFKSWPCSLQNYFNAKLYLSIQPPTDGLLLRGAYNTITLAVYGSLSKVNRDPQPTPSQPPQSPPLQAAEGGPPPPQVSSYLNKLRSIYEGAKMCYLVIVLILKCLHRNSDGSCKNSSSSINFIRSHSRNPMFFFFVFLIFIINPLKV